jgi:hypothetical protein
MSQVTRIEWTFHTSAAEGAGTDSPVRVEIVRDGQTLANPWDEPGETLRLDRGEVATRGWTFQNPTGLGTAVSGTSVPYFEDFPQGVRGHLRVTFRIHGDDAWRIGRIDSTVISGELKHVPGTIDAVRWVESREGFVFRGEDVLSTDASEGIVALTLNY